MKAIETIYKGIKFRSKLEATWAVFFDRLGIKYKYEPETFQLDGVYYLPDFLLPNLFNIPVYVEVKPDINGNPGSEVTITEHEDYSKKWYDFAKENCLMILFGPPSDTDFHIIKIPTYNQTFNFCSFSNASNEIVYSQMFDFNTGKRRERRYTRYHKF